MNLAVFIIAGGVTWLAMPWAAALAFRTGAVDTPGGRRLHQGVIPRLGGLGVWLGFWLAVGAYAVQTGRVPATAQALFFGSLTLLLIGVVDDVKGAGAWAKLPFQILAAQMMFSIGAKLPLGTVAANLLDLDPGLRVIAGLNWLATLGWIVGMTNAFNFIDGLDALAVTQGASATLGVMFFAHKAGNSFCVAAMVALLGALAAFLPFNRPPARLFLGDTGSTFLGFTLASLSVLACQDAHAPAGLRLAPIALMLVPLVDTLCAIGRRLAAGVSVFSADACHVHHRLLLAGFTRSSTVAILFGISLAMLGVSSCMAAASNPAAVAFLGGSLCVVGAAGVKLGLLGPERVETDTRRHPESPLLDEESETKAWQSSA